MKRYVPFSVVVVLVTIMFGTMYGIGQQILRLSANDPQVQLAHEVAVQLNDGTKIEDVVGAFKVNLEQSLAPFVIIYDKNGNPIAGTGYLNGSRPKIPTGVLQAAQGRSDNRVTWQPQNDVRVATVSVAAKNYYVLAGRSLREVEAREQKILQIAVGGWVASLLFLIVMFLAREKYPNRF